MGDERADVSRGGRVEFRWRLGGIPGEFGGIEAVAPSSIRLAAFPGRPVWPRKTSDSGAPAVVIHRTVHDGVGLAPAVVMMIFRAGLLAASSIAVRAPAVDRRFASVWPAHAIRTETPRASVKKSIARGGILEIKFEICDMAFTVLLLMIFWVACLRYPDHDDVSCHARSEISRSHPFYS